MDLNTAIMNNDVNNIKRFIDDGSDINTIYFIYT